MYNINLKDPSVHLSNGIIGLIENINKAIIMSFNIIFLQPQRLKVRLSLVWW